MFYCLKQNNNKKNNNINNISLNEYKLSYFHSSSLPLLTPTVCLFLSHTLFLLKIYLYIYFYFYFNKLFMFYVLFLSIDSLDSIMTILVNNFYGMFFILLLFFPLLYPCVYSCVKISLPIFVVFNFIIINFY